MVDHKYRCIFIHQRKCAGASVVRSFGYDFNDGPGTDYYRFNQGVQSKDWNERPTDYFVFSAVRNPFDRLISGWKNNGDTRVMPLEQIVENWPSEFHAHMHITRPQVNILRDRKTGKLVTEDLIRFETMQADFDRICDRLGKPRETMPHINSSERERDYRKYFTAYTRKLAEQHFADDLQTFGYEF